MEESEEDKKQAILQVVESLIADEGDVKDEYDDPEPEGKKKKIVEMEDGIEEI